MVLELFGGFIYLLLGGDLLVRGSLALAKKARISPMVVGLTVVAFGTSAPELFVSLGAVFKGHPGLSLGNVVGSNIANVLLVLGVPAMIYPTLCNQRSTRRDCGVLLAVSVVFAAMCALGPLGRVQGVLMLIVLAALLLRSAREGTDTTDRQGEGELDRVLGLPTRKRMILVFLGLGVVGLPLGSHLLVEGAVQVAESLGVSSTVIGLSMIAIGTSLPELATTLVAALRRQSDLAIGNVLGSNLFNILAIMGITAVVAPGPIPVPPSLVGFDLLVMIGAVLLLGFFAWIPRTIDRRSGALLLGAYVLYMVMVFNPPLRGITLAGLGN